MEDILNEEIARELIMEIDKNLPEEKFQQIWQACKGNPFDAPIIYSILSAVALPLNE